MRTVEPYFDFIERKDKPWILVISARAGSEISPRLAAPGGRRATLFRRPDEEIVLECMPYTVLRHLKVARNILVAEVNRDGETARIYQAPVE